MSAESMEPADPLSALADHCIQARGLADEVESDTVRHLLDALLFEVGKLIADSLHPPPVGGAPKPH